MQPTLEPETLLAMQSSFQKMKAALSTLVSNFCRKLATQFPRMALKLAAPERRQFMQAVCQKRGVSQRHLRRLNDRQLKKLYLLS
jgi:hypothetical protein